VGEPLSRVTVDPDLCIGSGECVRLLPDSFRIDERRGVSTPQPGVVTADRALLDEAAESCPTRAITVNQ
jgi:ferredoxin